LSIQERSSLNDTTSQLDEFTGITRTRLEVRLDNLLLVLEANSPEVNEWRPRHLGQPIEKLSVRMAVEVSGASHTLMVETATETDHRTTHHRATDPAGVCFVSRYL